MRCPLCKERIKRNAVKCRFCDTVVDKKTKEIQFIKNGFEKIEAECKSLERRITSRCGFIIRWHMFSEDELFEYIEKIENFALKIKSDIESWKQSGKVMESIKHYYNENAQRLYERLETIQEKIYYRHPTVWEKIGNFFKAFYYHIVEKLLPLITGRIHLGFKRQKEIPGTT